MDYEPQVTTLFDLVRVTGLVTVALSLSVAVASVVLLALATRERRRSGKVQPYAWWTMMLAGWIIIFGLGGFAWQVIAAYFKVVGPALTSNPEFFISDVCEPLLKIAVTTAAALVAMTARLAMGRGK